MKFVSFFRPKLCFEVYVLFSLLLFRFWKKKPMLVTHLDNNYLQWGKFKVIYILWSLLLLNSNLMSTTILMWYLKLLLPAWQFHSQNRFSSVKIPFSWSGELIYTVQKREEKKTPNNWYSKPWNYNLVLSLD